MDNIGKPADRIGLKISSSASRFKKILQAFANGDLPYSDVQSDLQRLLTTGASPEELREVLNRYESIEPVPAYAHVEVLRILDEAAKRAAALKAGPDPAQGQPQDSQSATTSISERAPETIAAAVEARTLPPPTVSAVAAIPLPVTARATARGGEPLASPGENVSSIEDRVARQRADYRALNHAYERVRDAGSAASARTIALAAELAAVRSALDSEQTKTRTLDKALAESMVSGEAARARGDEAQRELERNRVELRSVRDLLAARDATIDQMRLSVGEREDRLDALQRDHATRVAALDARASLGTQLEDDLRAERARSAALAAELAAARTALESAQNKVREADKALAEKVAFAETARMRKEEALRESQRYQIELGTLRQSLAARDATLVQQRNSLGERDAQLAALQREHAQTKAALELEHGKSRETRKALAERVTAEEAARTNGEDALRKLEGYRAELSKARDLLATRQKEQTKIVAALEARTTALEAQLEAAETRNAANQWESTGGHEITVALDPPRERGAAQPAAPPAADRDIAPAPTIERFDVRETARIAAPEPKRAAQLPEFPLFGSRRGWKTGAVARIIGVGAALAVLAAVVWILVRHAPVSENVPAVETAAAPKPGTVIRDCPTCPALTVVPAGRFKQGSSDRADGNSATFEKPPHWVLIGRPFAISTNAVTVDEFRAFVTATGRDMRGCDTYEDRWRIRPEASWESPGFVQTGSHPVTCVSWDDAKAYAGWLSKTTGHRYRLPSAAEWEYAARAGGEAVRPWSSDGSGACANANVADQRAARRYPGWLVFGCDDGYVYTAPVGSFKANSFGLNDMLGNVFQWTDDCWHADYTGVPTDGSARTYGNCSERELRGGSWFTTPDFVRASYRNHFGANYRASSVGIRLVRDLAS